METVTITLLPKKMWMEVMEAKREDPTLLEQLSDHIKEGEVIFIDDKPSVVLSVTYSSKPFPTPSDYNPPLENHKEESITLKFLVVPDGLTKTLIIETIHNCHTYCVSCSSDCDTDLDIIARQKRGEYPHYCLVILETSDICNVITIKFTYSSILECLIPE